MHPLLGVVEDTVFHPAEVVDAVVRIRKEPTDLFCAIYVFELAKCSRVD